MNRLHFFASALFIVLAAGCSRKEALFNGKDLSNWDFVVEDNAVPPSEVYSVVDGAILVQGKPLGYMYTKEKFRNFTLEVEWSWPEEATNSGIFLLIAEPKNPFPNGIECQLHAGDAGDFVLLGGSDLVEYVTPAEGRPPFPKIEKKHPSSEKPLGEWNKAKITVNEGVITVYINDVLQNAATNTVKEGHIGLQSEGGPIRFRNITISRQ
jgi:hypothetical protein